MERGSDRVAEEPSCGPAAQAQWPGGSPSPGEQGPAVRARVVCFLKGKAV